MIHVFGKVKRLGLFAGLSDKLHTVFLWEIGSLHLLDHANAIEGEIVVRNHGFPNHVAGKPVFFNQGDSATGIRQDSGRHTAPRSRADHDTVMGFAFVYHRCKNFGRFPQGNVSKTSAIPPTNVAQQSPVFDAVVVIHPAIQNPIS